MTCDPIRLDDALREEFIALRPGSAVPGTDKEHLWAHVHQLPDDQALTALCLSGGGIRSATFGLGVIQGLARAGLLDRIDYLSTVSGGGYIGGWLTAWIHRHPRKLDGVIEDLKAPASTPPLVPGGHRGPIQWLREYSNYLSPRWGLASPDTWTLAAIFLRNLILNWILILPLLLALVLIPRWTAAALYPFDSSLPEFVPLAQLALALGAFLIAWATSEIAVCWPGRPERKSEGYLVRQLVMPLTAGCWLKCTAYYHLAREDGFWQDRPLLGFAALGAAIHLGGWMIGWLRTRAPIPLAGWIAAPFTGALGGVASWLGARYLLNPWIVNDETYIIFATPALMMLLALGGVLFVGFASHREQWLNDGVREWWARCGAWLMMVAAGWTVVQWLVVQGPMTLAALLDWQRWAAGAGGVLAGIVAALAGWFGPRANGVSAASKRAHQSAWRKYAELLLTPLPVALLVATLSASVTAVVLGRWPSSVADHEAALFGRAWSLALLPVAAMGLWAFSAGCCRLMSLNRFTLHHMYRNRLIRAFLGGTRVDPKRPRQNDEITGFDPDDNLLLAQIARTQRPLHLLNFALNMTSGQRLAWQQRKAASFTASPLHVGSWVTNYQRPACYTDEGGLSLGTAIAISGAAATSNMGYYSSQILTFLMTVFNFRLGGWFPNPKLRDPGVLGKASPDSPRMLLAELLGQTDIHGDWVYLSDGGHFENLGLYEAVRRRCRYIIAADAAADPQGHLVELGAAIQKIRLDFGIDIEFVEQPNFQGTREAAGDHWTLLRVHYAAVDRRAPDGWILYLKPALSPGLPADVQTFATGHPDFPHQSTVDQFYSENQFEAYRHLGEETVRRLAGPLRGSLVSVFRSSTARHSAGAD